MPSTSSSPDGRARRGRVALTIGIAVVLLVAAITAVAIASIDDDSATGRGACPSDVAEASNPHVGDDAPAFTLPTLDGDCFRLRSARGRPVVVNFWASWCNPCRKEFPLLADARDEHEGDGLEIVGVTYRDIESDARRFADEQDAQWPLAFDDDQRIARAYGVNAIPQTIFVRRDGTIAARVFGELSKSDLDQELRKILRP